MAEKIGFIPQQPIVPISRHKRVATHGKGARAVPEQDASVAFQNVLGKHIAEEKRVRFSGHAQQRLKMRDIQFTAEQLERITDALDRAASKGARDSLLLVDNIAAVVSVENRTIVTVVGKETLKDNVFTNIDSAVIA